MGRRCVIVGGAAIGNYEKTASFLRADDFFIYCDSGLSHEKSLGKCANLIVGDFDSHDRPERETETIVLPREKDDTDTIFAIKEGIRRGYDEFILVGVVGARLDHTLVNVYALKYLANRGKSGIIIDDYSQMELVTNCAFVDPSFSYFSLVNCDGTAKGITIENAKFPLLNGEIDCEYQYATSNETLPDTTAKITVAEGSLLLIKIF